MPDLRARVFALRVLPQGLCHLAALAVVFLVLVAAGQPLFSEDLWWHLSMGRAYAAAGPWLAADPVLHTAVGPPAPAAWLASLSFYAVEQIVGFQGLRVLHVLLVAAISLLAWGLLRAVSGSALFASLGTIVFEALSAYRLFQLRPHLFTMLGALLMLRLLVVTGRPVPSWGRVGAAVLLIAVWANLHAGFVLGLALIGAALAGSLLGMGSGTGEERERARACAGRLVVALVLGFVAGLANPIGIDQYLPYLAAGADTPGLESVVDEWSRVDLLQLPPANLPPSLLSWLLVWAIGVSGLVAVLWSGLRWLSAMRQGCGSNAKPGLAAVAMMCLVACASAVRFLWLGIGPLLLLGHALRMERRRLPPGIARSWASALVGLLLVPAFVASGAWPMISKGVHARSYSAPYQGSKVDAHAIDFLLDTGLEGNLYNDYSDGGFLGYWLAPQMRTFLNGSLNVPKEVMAARHAIQANDSSTDGGSVAELLDRYEVDVFFGRGLAVASLENRPYISTTPHLEGRPGWILVFRNLRTALYLRDDPRNHENLARVTDYYARGAVPFDPAAGFDVMAVIRGAPQWALAHGMVPRGFPQLERAAASLDPVQRPAAILRLASLYASLGRYDRASSLSRSQLRADPGSWLAARVRLWSALRARSRDELPEAIASLEAILGEGGGDALSRALLSSARLVLDLDPDADLGLDPDAQFSSQSSAQSSAQSPAQVDALLAGLPLFARAEVSWLMQDVFLGGTRAPR